MALVFVFWVTFGGQLFELLARETNLKKQSSVEYLRTLRLKLQKAQTEIDVVLSLPRAD